MNNREVICLYCKIPFLKRIADINRTAKNFCSIECSSKYSRNILSYLENINCFVCKNKVLTTNRQRKNSKSGYIFCSRSCAAKYNNSVRKKTTRSKIEIKFGEELHKLFPSLVFDYNNKTVLGGYELDIYIESLNLAIEWNGIVHYFPIYGEEKLKQIQYRDYKKQLLCQEKQIELITICDFKSDAKILKETICKVASIITNKLSGAEG